MSSNSDQVEVGDNVPGARQDDVPEEHEFASTTLSLQLADVEELARQLKLLKKEPIARRTSEKLTAYEGKVSRMWAEVQERHRILAESGEASASSSYIRDDIFGEAGKCVSAIFSTVEKYRVVRGQSDKVLKDRASRLALLDRFINLNSDFSEFTPDEEEVEFLLKKLKSLSDAFFEATVLVPQTSPGYSSMQEETAILLDQVALLQDQLVSFRSAVRSQEEKGEPHCREPASASGVGAGDGSTFASAAGGSGNSSNGNSGGGDNNPGGELAIQFVSMMKQLFSDHVEFGSKSESRSITKLPTLEVPKFDGTLRKWLYFKGAFESSIHNNKSLDSIQKMRYLQMFVVGKASSLISRLDLSEKNYETAWGLMLRRYHNPKLLINELIESLLKLKRAKWEKAEEVRSVLDESKEIIYSLQNLGEVTWNAMIVYLVCSKLPEETLALWEQSCGSSTSIADFSLLEDFLENRIRALEAIESKGRPVTGAYVSGVEVRAEENCPRVSGAGNGNGRPFISSLSCPLCSRNHMLHRCEEFLKLSSQERLSFVVDKRLCHLCFNSHSVQNCKFTWKCNICRGRHNALIHGGSSFLAASASVDEAVVVLPTAQVMVTSRNGVRYPVKIMIDQGSMRSFVSEEIMQMLQWERSADSTMITGVSGKATRARGNTTFSLSSVFEEGRQFTVNALILPRLGRELPQVDEEPLVEFEDLLLADPQFFRGGPVNIILGSMNLPQLMMTDVILGSLLAQKTHLGWILSGPYHAAKTSKAFKSGRQLQSFVVQESSDDSFLRKFWETEEKVVERNCFSDEENKCEEFYKATTTIGDDGRYICRLPFTDGATFGQSKHIAVANQLRLEQRFSRDSEFKDRYVQSMEEYFELGHARSAPIVAAGDPSYFIPHLAVIKEASTSTKTRIVFNASSRSSNKKSLNDNLMIGPTIQRDLVEKIMSFRLHAFVFVCDIVKMYRQINIHRDDWPYQLFVWRKTVEDPIQDFCLTTVTFGTASAPFTAVRTLQQLSEDKKEEFPVGSKIISTGSYVDDIHFGSVSLSEGKRGRDEMIAVLESASFEARKFASNHPLLLSDLPSAFVAEGDVHSFLGLLWNSSQDSFTFKSFGFDNGTALTKRRVLSDISKIFDPMGWIQPLIVPAKILLQDIWKADLKWDDELNEELKVRWLEIKSSVTDLSFVQLSRSVGELGVHGEPVELHGFADASQRAYGAVVYIRLGKTNPSIRLLLAKSRIAPVKVTSIPRLELKAALLLADLMQKVMQLLRAEDLNPIPFGWSDSKVTLAWIKSSPEKWKPFVRNRVASIQELMPQQNWNYVPTDNNPADVISRGCDAATFRQLSFWFNGPEWLLQHQVNFHNSTSPLESEDLTSVQSEEKKVVISCSAQVIEKKWIVNVAENSSNFKRSCRIVAWVRRFITNYCRGGGITNPELTVEEISAAERLIIKGVQQHYFIEECTLLAKSSPLPNRSCLVALNPFVDDEGCLRVQGRLQNAHIPFDQKFPLILPYDCPVTTQIVLSTHEQLLHGGAQVTLNALRLKFWIVRGLQRVKAILFRCVKCFKARPRNQRPIMGLLPEPRVHFTKPFLHSGVDFAGPFRVRISSGRGTRTVKAYIAVFVCLSTKAFHLEVVSSLTTDAFIAALMRFTSRRGRVNSMFSDNGTNFVGAFRKLTRVATKMTELGIEWSFLPPLSPHFGGLWEAGVKSVKTHLRRAFGNESFTFEEMQTVLCQVEGCLNARPLCALSEDVENLDALTPAHFLTGQQFVPLPEEDHTLYRPSLLSRWQRVSKVYQDVCMRYKTEYLSRLLTRPKWVKPSRSLEVGQLVLIREDNCKVNEWPLGRITILHPGSDGNVRVVTVSTVAGDKKRSVVRLYPLPVDVAPGVGGTSPDAVDV